MENAAPVEPRAQLIKALRDHQTLLWEVLQAIERRDMSPGQIREHLGWLGESLRDLRKDSTLLKP